MSTASLSSPASRARARSLDLASIGGWVVLMLALLISIGPFLYLISMSLMDNPQLFGGKIVAWPIFPANYPAAWVATKIGTLYWNSIYISTVSMALTVMLSALAGYGL